MGRPQANKRSNRSTITEKKRRYWNAREKIAIIMYHENGHSKNKTAAKSKTKIPALETALLTWVKEKRKNQNAVMRSMIQMKAKALAQQRQCNHRHTTVAQRLPDDLVEKQQEFLSYIMYRHIQYDYPLAYIGNIDETPVSFNLPSNTTIDELGARSVSIHTTGHEKANFTVVLTCMADGTKLPLLIIFKLKNVPQGNFPPEVIIRTNQKRWMNENKMLYWIENIWTKRERISNPQSSLVLDSFSAHIVDSVKRHSGEKNTNIAVIPEGLTSRLQPLDVSVNKSFKTKMRRNYNERMAEAVKELTPADEEYVDEEEETDEKYVDEGGEEDEEGEYEGEEDGYDDEYYGHYDQGTNYINVWDD
ncbi:pogo transposable element with KRAB domain [Rhizophagus clarus]|uniref:Pogo transposable element with KRAB domain n=1 Tax=Rhizophagus clarus TaxID=94130 RepID=A0A8H3MFZ3_9GLOM|nr:pogo transposable element with KRAB domain [Rhizophagus clarus]